MKSKWLPRVTIAWRLTKLNGDRDDRDQEDRERRRRDRMPQDLVAQQDQARQMRLGQDVQMDQENTRRRTRRG